MRTVSLTMTSFRALTGLAVALTAIGVALLAWPTVTDLQAARVQARLEAALDAQDRVAARYGLTGPAAVPLLPGPVSVSADPARPAGQPGPTGPSAGRLVRLAIPAVDLDVVVVDGVDAAALSAGVGHYPDTPWPGGFGNAGLAGHRTTYGSPFADLDRLEVGDVVTVTGGGWTHTYRVADPPAGTRRCPSGGCWITDPHDVDVLAPTPTPTVTLTTCHPRRSDRERLVVRAELVDSTRTA